MTVPAQSEAELSILRKTDGSASYSQNGYSIIGSVNGPIEVQRRDELADEAAIDVIIRPANGPGGVRERHLESLVHATLRHVILVQQHPRTLIQLTLQIIESPDLSYNPTQASSYLPILPALLQTSILTVLSASLPLATIFTCTLITVSKGQAKADPSPADILEGSSAHVLCFSSRGDLLLAESEGEFSIDEWDRVFDMAQRICCGRTQEHQSGHEMETDEEVASIQSFLADTMSRKVQKDLQWKEQVA